MIAISKFHFFKKPRFFFHIQRTPISRRQLFFIFRENSTVITYLCNISLGNIIFLERKTLFCSLGINFRCRKLIQASVSCKNHLNLDFLKFKKKRFHLEQDLKLLKIKYCYFVDIYFTERAIRNCLLKFR